tara:strand:- start:100 stop:240 length:141 start_codon:yes stop_codon:yes gene_type:complete
MMEEEKDGEFLSKRQNRQKKEKEEEEEKEKKPSSLCSVDDERARES